MKTSLQNKIPSFDEIYQRLSDQKTTLAEKYKLRSLGVFGSYTRNEQNSKSDLDVLIDYEEAPSLFTLIKLEYHLSELLGVNIDLITRKGIKPPLRKRILEEVVYL